MDQNMLSCQSGTDIYKHLSQKGAKPKQWKRGMSIKVISMEPGTKRVMHK